MRLPAVNSPSATASFPNLSHSHTSVCDTVICKKYTVFGLSLSSRELLETLEFPVMLQIKFSLVMLKSDLGDTPKVGEGGGLVARRTNQELEDRNFLSNTLTSNGLGLEAEWASSGQGFNQSRVPR